MAPHTIDAVSGPRGGPRSDDTLPHVGTPDTRRSAGGLEAVFAPVHSQTAFEETVERLGTAIKLGLLEPGTRLRAEALSSSGPKQRTWADVARATRVVYTTVGARRSPEDEVTGI